MLLGYVLQTGIHEQQSGMCGGGSSVGTPGGDDVASVATAHAEVGPAKNRAVDAVPVFEVICMFSPAHWKQPEGQTMLNELTFVQLPP